MKNLVTTFLSINKLVLCAVTLMTWLTVEAQQYTFSTLAGLTKSPGTNDGLGSVARFNIPTSVAVDEAGNVYVADTQNHTIRKITSAGLVTTLAGLPGKNGTADGTGDGARLCLPGGIALDHAGDLYFTDSGNYTLRKVTPAGTVTTIAGSAGKAGSVDGTGSAAQFRWAIGVAVDAGGNAYVADNGNSTIRKVTPAGVVTTVAGLAVNPGTSDGLGSAARFNGPSGIAVDGAGNLYVADYKNHTIRKITPSGLVTTLAGSPGISGSADGIGDAARFKNPTGVALDGVGNLIVADSQNYTIRKVRPSGMVTTLAGLAGSYGHVDGEGTVARFYNVSLLAVGAGGDLFVPDSDHTVRVGLFQPQPEPVIVAHPKTVAPELGVPVSFTVISDGNSPLSYQWRKDMANIQGATSSTHTVPAVQASDAGNYDVVVTNTYGGATSQVAILTFAPLILSQPHNTVINPGASAIFKVTAGGASPKAYQWRKNGSNLGAGTAAAFTIPKVRAIDNAAFDVVVTNSYGSATSQVALLTVIPPLTTRSWTGSLNSTLSSFRSGTVAFTETIGTQSTVSGFSLYLSWREGLYSYTATIPVNGTCTVQDGQFDLTTGSIAIHGQMNDPINATGTFNITGYWITFQMPYGPYRYQLFYDGTWSAHTTTSQTIRLACRSEGDCFTLSFLDPFSSPLMVQTSADLLHWADWKSLDAASRDAWVVLPETNWLSHQYFRLIKP